MPKKILVVDDEPDMVASAKMVLEGDGYVVATASSGEEALRKVDSENPDLILLDVRMPGISGVETCRILKGKPKTKRIPVIVFTASGGNPSKLVEEAGADGYCPKPFALEQLMTEVKRLLPNSPGARPN